jgi:hypothetical protein
MAHVRTFLRFNPLYPAEGTVRCWPALKGALQAVISLFNGDAWYT